MSHQDFGDANGTRPSHISILQRTLVVDHAANLINNTLDHQQMAEKYFNATSVKPPPGPTDPTRRRHSSLYRCKAPPFWSAAWMGQIARVASPRFHVLFTPLVISGVYVAKVSGIDIAFKDQNNREEE